MSRTSLLIGFLAGGWAATLLIAFVPHLNLGVMPEAQADDPPPATQPDTGGLPELPIPLPPIGGPPDAGNPTLPGRLEGRGIPREGGGTADSNNRAIALAASIGSGESVVYYFDTVANRILVYQYKGLVNGNRPLRPGDKGGLRLLAARHIDYDLRLQGYRDLSEKNRDELKDMFEGIYGPSKSGKKKLPVKKVSVGGG